ncbi:MAG: hypothetical protein HY051_05305 [Candidatus Aenigmarchaeota archaeon]|nr:hypothetical protein [Candidatus Aenigmarchaeota archaeon]
MPRQTGKRSSWPLYIAIILLFLAIGLEISLLYKERAKAVVIDTPNRQAILSGVSNPGRLIVYSFNGHGYDRDIIETGYTLVHTVIEGDARNDGKDRIYVGVSNSYFRQPYGCEVIEYEKADGEWVKSVVERVGDVRCKDLTIGDADNDKKNELILGTHGEGLVNVYKWDSKGNKWIAQNIGRNWIGKIDAERGTNHRIARENLTYDAIDQTAVHKVKVGDADNDGKNELIATESSSLAYVSGPQISFVNVYKWNGTGWLVQTIREDKGFQHRSILIEDVDEDGKNDVVIGTSNGKLIMIKKSGDSWNESLIDNETLEKNMKGVDYGYLYNTANKSILLATGFPHAMVYSFDWNGQAFEKKIIANISSIMSNVVLDLSYNAMEAMLGDVNADGKNEIVVAGFGQTSTMGWEATPFGFLLVYSPEDAEWKPVLLDTYSVLGMDLGNV